MSGRFVGVDLHKRFCVYAELDMDGNVISRGRFGNNIKEVSDFASRLSPGTKLTVEPLLNYLWFLDQVKPYVDSVHPANPYKVRVIAEAKTKTDKYDSLMLAELLRTNFLPESYYIPKDIRWLRDIIRQRSHLVRSRTQYKNRIRHLLFLNGSRIKATDVSLPKAINEIKKLYLPDTTRQSIEQCLTIIKVLDIEIKTLTNQILKSSQDVEDVRLLETIPGIGSLLATTIYAEIVDINRFRSGKAFASFTGLVPIVRATGDSIYIGGITKVGSRPLRCALVEAAIRALYKSAALSRLFFRVLNRSNSQKARVAVAHKLALIIYVMLKKGEIFRI
jgi:transposase